MRSPARSGSSSVADGPVNDAAFRLISDVEFGAGAVVTRDVAPGATVVGSPARPLPVPVGVAG